MVGNHTLVLQHIQKHRMREYRFEKMLFISVVFTRFVQSSMSRSTEAVPEAHSKPAPKILYVAITLNVWFHLFVLNGSLSLTLVMDGVLTIDLLCFFGFLISYSSSSRS